MVRVKNCALGCPAVTISITTVLVLLLVYGMRSDYDELNPFIGELLPAGHCLCHTSANIQCSTCLDTLEKSANPQCESNLARNWVYKYGRDDTNEGLSTAQCTAAFPGLFEDINRAVSLRRNNHIQSEELSSMKMYKGMVRAMIYNGEVRTIQNSAGEAT